MSREDKVHVTVRMPKNLYSDMQEVADEMGISRTSFINTSIYRTLNTKLVSQVITKIKKEKSRRRDSHE
jgi:hypothetical protein